MSDQQRQAEGSIMDDLKNNPTNDRSFNAEGDFRTEQVTGTTSGAVERAQTTADISEPFEPASVRLRDEKGVKE